METGIRRKDRMLTETEARAVLQRGEYGVLSVVDEDSYPYGVPVNYVYDGDNIYFHCAQEGHKVEALRHSPKACFTVVGPTEVLPDKFSTRYESAVAFVKGFEVTDAAEKTEALQKLVLKYAPDFVSEGDRYIAGALSRAAVYRLQIEAVTGKARRR